MTSAEKLHAAQARFDAAKTRFSAAAVDVLLRKPGAFDACTAALREFELARKALSAVHGSPVKRMPFTELATRRDE